MHNKILGLLEILAIKNAGRLLEMVKRHFKAFNNHCIHMYKKKEHMAVFQN